MSGVNKEERKYMFGVDGVIEFFLHVWFHFVHNMDKLQMFYNLESAQGIQDMVPSLTTTASTSTITPTSATKTPFVALGVIQLVIFVATLIVEDVSPSLISLKRGRNKY